MRVHEKMIEGFDPDKIKTRIFHIGHDGVPGAAIAQSVTPPLGFLANAGPHARCGVLIFPINAR